MNIHTQHPSPQTLALREIQNSAGALFDHIHAVASYPAGLTEELKDLLVQWCYHSEAIFTMARKGAELSGDAQNTSRPSLASGCSPTGLQRVLSATVTRSTRADRL